VTIEVDGELISKPYIDITLRLLARFGIAVEREGWQRFVLPQGSAYRTPGRIHVEGDASSASYFIALGAIAGTDQPVRIEGVGLDSIQGDIRFVEAAQAMGAQVTGGPGWLEVQRGAWPLKAIDAGLQPHPRRGHDAGGDGAVCRRPHPLRNIASWRVKETDRIAAMATELRKLGATVTRAPTSSKSSPWPALAGRQHPHLRRPPHGHVPVAGGLQPAGGGPVPVRILDPKCVGKTFPDYFETLFEVVTPAATRCRC
jgi:3-phosphoshikimate 1-carboxyvinyltransferase